jgi:two-component system, OmpR family, response regulator
MPLTNTAALSVLIVDDDPDIRELLTTYFEGQGIFAMQAEREAQMWEQIDACAPDVILLDVNLGAEDGFAIARKLRQTWHGGLLMVTGRGDMVDRVVGLELGADDYVAKPFQLRELLARVRSVGRRVVRENLSNNSASGSPEPTPPTVDTASCIVFEQFSLFRSARELRDAAGNVVSLTTGEFDLLCVLVDNAARVLSRDELLRHTHNRNAGPFHRTIDVQIGRLRKKLLDIGPTPRIVKSVRGAGYVFAVPVTKR